MIHLRVPGSTHGAIPLQEGAQVLVDAGRPHAVGGLLVVAGVVLEEPAGDRAAGQLDEAPGQGEAGRPGTPAAT